MQVSLSEFLEKVSKLKTKQEKIDALKYNDTLPLRVILQSTFDSTVKWLLPTESPPPYKPNELFDQEHILINDCLKLRYFVEGFHPNLTPHKREMMFIELLERVDRKDAEMLCAMLNKQLPNNNYGGKITYNMVKEAFPGMLQDEAMREEEARNHMAKISRLSHEKKKRAKKVEKKDEQGEVFMYDEQLEAER